MEEDNNFGVPLKTRNHIYTIAECMGILCKIGYLLVGIIAILVFLMFLGIGFEGSELFLLLIGVATVVVFMFISVKKFSDEMTMTIVRRDSDGFERCIGYLKNFFLLMVVLLSIAMLSVFSTSNLL